MGELLNNGVRRGVVQLPDLVMPDQQTQLELSMPVDLAALPADRPTAVTVTIEQSEDGVLWWPLGGFGVHDLRTLRGATHKDGTPITRLWGRFTEQTYRHDIFMAHHWREAYQLKRDEDGAWYHVLMLARQWRVTIDSYVPNDDGGRIDHADLGYRLDGLTRLTPRPQTPRGHRSASLLGVFAAAEAGASSVTSGSRTTTAGSLVTVSGGAWNSNSAINLTLTSNQAGTYTKLQEVDFGAFSAIALAADIGGTRAAGHTVTSAQNAGANSSVGGQEWDGIASSPTIVSDQATGTGTAPTDAIAVGAASLVLLHFGYDGSSTTMAVNDGTQAQEIDENNDRQAQAVHYKVAQTGTPSITGTLGASRAWGASIAAFTETAAGGATSPRGPLGFPLHGALGKVVG